MIYMLCRNRVEDYARWRVVFDSHKEAHQSSGLRLIEMWRDLEDPNNIFFSLEVTDLASAREFISTPEAAEAGEVSGVIDGEAHFVESIPCD